jgi:hypothetical protein
MRDTDNAKDDISYQSECFNDTTVKQNGIQGECHPFSRYDTYIFIRMDSTIL